MSDEMMSATRTPIAGMIVGMTVITAKMTANLNATNASLTEDGDNLLDRVTSKDRLSKSCNTNN